MREVIMKNARTYSRHGLNALKARVKVRGLTGIDGRTAAAQDLFSWRRQLLTDLGGAENVSAGESALIELVARTRLYIDHVDAFLLEQESLVNKRKKVLCRWSANGRLWSIRLRASLGSLASSVGRSQ
jgi:hypothetical protein